MQVTSTPLRQFAEHMVSVTSLQIEAGEMAGVANPPKQKINHQVTTTVESE
jgi:hypothetical protein